MIHKTDGYKLDHRSQYPEGTEMVFANWTPRKSRIVGIDKVILAGLQFVIKAKLIDQWEREFFSQPIDNVVEKYRRRVQGMGIDITYDHIYALHALGFLPLEIWALPEGTAVPIGVPMFVMWNTIPEFFWLTNYIETSLSCNLWGMCTSATIAKQYRKQMLQAAYLSGMDPGFVDIQGHDFSYRGMYGDEAAAMSSFGHLLSFNGTDTIPGIDLACDYYGASDTEVGGTIAATEHSVMCMGTKEAELETYRRLITEVYPSGPISIVSDTWDFWHVMTVIVPALKKEILAREGGPVVFRPDSGDPADIICGDPTAPVGSPAFKGTYELLYEIFEGTSTRMGFQLLDDHVGSIYGDSITLQRQKDIATRLMAKGFCPSTVLGIGSYTYQMVTRDTFGFALKSTAGTVKGELREIFKDPITDSGEKKSLKGLFTVDHNLKVVRVETLEGVKSGAFRPVFLNGEPGTFQTLADIRALVRDYAV